MSDDELSPEVRQGLRRAFEIAGGRRWLNIAVDDLPLGLLCVRARVGIA